MNVRGRGEAARLHGRVRVSGDHDRVREHDDGRGGVRGHDDRVHLSSYEAEYGRTHHQGVHQLQKR